MARMAGTVWQGEHGSRLMQRYDCVCYHTIVGFAPAHAAHFSVHGDGRIDQSRDTRFQSAANLEGNYRIIAIENEDTGPPFPAWSGSNVPPLTPAQVQANARILRWAHDTHGVPLQLCPDSRPTSRGLAYHRQGIDGNFTGPYQGRVPGGEVWTEHFGKACPGDRRIDQRSAILSLATGSDTGDDDLPYTIEQIVEAAADGVDRAFTRGGGATRVAIGTMFDSQRVRLIKASSGHGQWAVTNGVVKRQVIGNAHANFLAEELGVAYNGRVGGDVQPYPVELADFDAIPTV